MPLQPKVTFEVIKRDRREVHLGRRLFHMAAAAVFPVLALFLDEDFFFVLLLLATVALVAGDIARLLVPPLNRLFLRWLRSLLRMEEENRITGATYVLVGTLAAFALFQRDVAILAVLFLALGDPVAAMVGVRFHRGRVFGKSPWGSLAMAVTALGVAGVLHLAGAIDFQGVFVVGALVAAATEILPLPVNDNLTVPLSAGAAMTILGA